MWGGQSTSVPGQFFASFCLPRVSVNSCRDNVLFEHVQLGFEVFYLLLEIFKLLRASVSAVCDGDQPYQYLIMLDERAHSTEGGLQGREPISGLLQHRGGSSRHRQLSVSLLGDSNSQRVDFTEGVESTHIDSDQRYSQQPRNSSNVAFETWFCFWNGLWWADVTQMLSAT